MNYGAIRIEPIRPEETLERHSTYRWLVLLAFSANAAASSPRGPGRASQHTCFNQLCMPRYPNKTIMKRMLDLAIENADGFGFV